MRRRINEARETGETGETSVIGTSGTKREKGRGFHPNRVPRGGHRIVPSVYS